MILLDFRFRWKNYRRTSPVPQRCKITFFIILPSIVLPDGDSGSLIVTVDARQAIALLFAGGDAGGSNSRGLTYGNPLRTVLDKLKVDLAL